MTCVYLVPDIFLRRTYCSSIIAACVFSRDVQPQDAEHQPSLTKMVENVFGAAP